MKTQTIGYLAWSKWNDKTAAAAHFVPAERKSAATGSVRVSHQAFAAAKKFTPTGRELASAFTIYA